MIILVTVGYFFWEESLENPIHHWEGKKRRSSFFFNWVGSSHMCGEGPRGGRAYSHFFLRDLFFFLEGMCPKKGVPISTVQMTG